jgi:hypothetical protein
MSKPTTHFLGTTSDRNKAFPDIDEIEFAVSQDPYGHYPREAWQRTRHYTKADLPERIPCANPRCQQGGLPTQQIVWFQLDGEHEFSCNGHEGTPAGRRKGNPCDNIFAVTLKVTRSTAAAPTAATDSPGQD